MKATIEYTTRYQRKFIGLYTIWTLVTIMCFVVYIFLFFFSKKKRRKILLALSCNLFKWLDHVFMFYELNSVRNTNNFFLVGKKLWILFSEIGLKSHIYRVYFFCFLSEKLKYCQVFFLKGWMICFS